jgi:hypothetical protein
MVISPELTILGRTCCVRDWLENRIYRRQQSSVRLRRTGQGATAAGYIQPQSTHYPAQVFTRSTQMESPHGPFGSTLIVEAISAFRVRSCLIDDAAVCGDQSERIAPTSCEV